MLPYRSAPGIPCVRFAPRPLRSAKGTGLSEPQITRIALMGYDFRGLVDGFIEVNVLSERGRLFGVDGCGYRECFGGAFDFGDRVSGGCVSAGVGI